MYRTIDYRYNLHKPYIVLEWMFTSTWGFRPGARASLRPPVQVIAKLHSNWRLPKEAAALLATFPLSCETNTRVMKMTLCWEVRLQNVEWVCLQIGDPLDFPIYIAIYGSKASGQWCCHQGGYEWWGRGGAGLGMAQNSAVFFFHILEDEDQFQPFRCEKGTRIQIYVSIPVDGLC